MVTMQPLTMSSEMVHISACKPKFNEEICNNWLKQKYGLPRGAELEYPIYGKQ